MTSTEKVETPKRAPRTITEFQKWEGPIYAENVCGKRVSCNEPNLDVSFWLWPKGSLQGDSIMVIPPKALSVPGFRRLVLRGHVLLSTDIELMEAKIDALAQGQVGYEDDRRNSVMQMLGESNADKDLVETTCLISNEKIWQTVRDQQDGIPPLADRFKDRAREFLATKVVKDDGTSNYVFSKVQIG